MYRTKPIFRELSALGMSNDCVLSSIPTLGGGNYFSIAVFFDDTPTGPKRQAIEKPGLV